MSVLFKALQKAEKENEQRQTHAGGFDPERLAGAGTVRRARASGINWRIAGISVVGVLAIAVAGAFFFATSETAPMKTASKAPQPSTVTQVAPGTTETIPVLQPPANATPTAAAAPPATPAQPTAVAQAQAPAPAAETQQPQPAASEPPPEVQQAQQTAALPPPAAPAEPREAQVASATPAPKQDVAKVSVRPQAMPDLPADFPARMLNPPISVARAEFNLSGVGKAVQVREVSQNARSNVSAGYDALVRGSYDTSLGFYDTALKDEPTSMLAQLGRAAALQKLGRAEEARIAYEKVLKSDPDNREALSNITVILGESAPAEALTKLLDLEKQYSTFSPVKAQIGLTYAKMGSMPQALDYLRRAIALSPESVMYQYNFALVLDHLGESTQAVSAYKTVLASLSAGRGAPEISVNDIERRVQYLQAR